MTIAILLAILVIQNEIRWNQSQVAANNQVAVESPVVASPSPFACVEGTWCWTLKEAEKRDLASQEMRIQELEWQMKRGY
ncbi:hypothetical protein NITHO_4880013 [Nitrolancea hollandica Lb]|uniref:Uncharacterized protein n=1 Tax=Nitrolancea hollandica Lb TaxID=1129897 RepID=I4EL06_9BACT|nr:hypothetical protein NITHO_4880013 [Nitrolancea hollandica Lb]